MTCSCRSVFTHPSTACPRAPCHSIGNYALPDINDHSLPLLCNESTGMCTVYYNTYTLLNLCHQSLTFWGCLSPRFTRAMNIASTCHYSCQTDLTFFPKGNLFLHLLLLVQLTTGFQGKGCCCGSVASQKGKRTKVLLQNSQKTCNVLCRLGVLLSNGWESQRIPVWNAPLLQLVLGTVQKEEDIGRLQLLFASNAD